MENLDVHITSDVMRGLLELAGIEDFDEFAVETQGEALLAATAAQQHWARVPDPGQLIEVQYSRPTLTFVLPDGWTYAETPARMPDIATTGFRMQRSSQKPKEAEAPEEAAAEPEAETGGDESPEASSYEESSEASPTPSSTPPS